MTLERLWAGWRTEYVTGGGDSDGGCVFCAIAESDEPHSATNVLWRGERSFAVLNAYPYGSGHLMVVPLRHVGELEQLEADEAAEVWASVTDAVRAVKAAYQPDGLNLGINLGRSAGAGVPGHFHVHCLPRWNGDTNFMTSVAETRVVPETLSASWARLTAVWPTK